MIEKVSGQVFSGGSGFGWLDKTLRAHSYIVSLLMFTVVLRTLRPIDPRAQ